jgi:hypothetical protein
LRLKSPRWLSPSTATFAANVTARALGVGRKSHQHCHPSLALGASSPRVAIFYGVAAQVLLVLALTVRIGVCCSGSRSSSQACADGPRST